MRADLNKAITKELKFWQVLLPVLFLIALISYSLILRPRFLGQEPLPLEIVFILAAAFTITELRILGFKWEEVQRSITGKLGRALPAFFILFSIGVIISSWIISGTIPMLVYWGIKIIHPKVLYLLAFLVPVVFSTLTGTSFGSIGTIGVVFIGVATALEANLGITAGAVIGGAFFGDKLSPLSDTTNLAAMSAEVDLYAHIRSMLYTTVPSALLAAGAYAVLGLFYSPASVTGGVKSAQELLASLDGFFSFNVLLLLPPAIVLWGSFRKKPTIPVLMGSAFSACILALLFQRYAVTDILTSLVTGFNVEMAPWMSDIPSQAVILLNRGGLYELVDLVVLTFIVFIFIGALDHIRAMPVIVDRIMGKTGSRSGTILTSLFATGFTSAVTSNQYATIFIIGDAFKERYNKFGIPRAVLSRSLEDYGTMLGSLIPWHMAVIFSVATLGVPFSDFWHWQLISLINLAIAPLLAITGIGCMLKKDPAQ
jgi:Na+:H+ antiporter, NhaC family